MADDLDSLWQGDQKSAPQTAALPDLDSLWQSPKAATSPSAPPAQPSTLSDVAKSTAEGAREGTEGIVGLPRAIVGGERWLIAKALEKVGAINSAEDTLDWINRKTQGTPFSIGTLPSTEDVHAAVSAAGVPEYQPQTTAGKYAKTVGEFVPGALTMGEASAPAIAGNIAKYAVAPGLASEAAGQMFSGTKAEPYARMAAGLAGGIGAAGLEQAGRAAYGAGTQFAEPLTQAGQQNWAARTFQNMFSDPDAALAALAIAKERQQPGQALGEVIPGSKPTTGQLTGDMGALSNEREMATLDPAFSKENPAGTGTVQQNAARTAALEGVQPTGAPEAVGQAVRDRLAQIEAEHDATHAAALKSAQDAAAGIGGASTPEAIGANLRSALQSGRDAAKTNERALWNAVDPDGTLALPAGPIAQAAEKVAGSVPKTAKPMAGEEAAIFDTAQNLPPVAPFNDITALRSRISTAMREELRSSGQTPTYARLAQLRDSVEGAITGAVDNRAAIETQAVAKGELAPGQTIGGRLQAEANEYQRTKSQIASGAGPSQGVGGNAASGSSGLSSANRTEIPGNGRLGNPAGDQSVSLTPNVDEAAAARLRQASAATRERAKTFDQGPVGAALKTQGQAGDYRLADAAVPAKMFSPGPQGAETIAAYREAAGPEGETFLHDAAAQSLNREAMRDGVLDPDKFVAWSAKHQDSLRALPDTLKAKFANAASASDALAEAAATRKAALDHYQKSAAGKFIGLKNPQDITRTVGGIFEAKDGVERMTQLASALKDNPDAAQGLRKAVADYIMSKAKGTTEAGTSGVENLNAGRFQNLIRNNAQTLKAAGFSDEEVGLMRAIGEDMQRSQRTLQATRLAGQSNSPQDLVKNIRAIAERQSHSSLLGEMLFGGLGGFWYGGLHGSVLGGLGGAGSHFARQLAMNIRSAGIGKASELVRDAMYNPELARALLAKTPTKVGAGAYLNLSKALENMAVFTGESTTRREHRAAGGSVRKRLSHEQLVSRLMDLSERAKNATKRDTKALLSVPDNTVAKALEVAQKAI